MEKQKLKQLMMEKPKNTNLEEESTYGLMEENTVEIGPTIYKMDKVNSSTPTESSTMVTGLMEPRTEMACRTGRMDPNTKEIGLTTVWKALVTISLQMEVNTMATGLITNSMDTVDKPGQMAEAMRVNSIMESKKDKVFIHGQTVRSTMVHGLTANNMEKELSQHPREKSEEVSGPTVSEQSGLRKLKSLQEIVSQIPKLRLKIEKTKKKLKPKKNLRIKKTQLSIMLHKSLQE